MSPTPEAERGRYEIAYLSILENHLVWDLCQTLDFLDRAKIEGLQGR